MDDAPPQEIFFRLSGAGDSMWEIGRVQPTIAKLAEKGLLHGDMLDIGCGIGDNAIYIAQNTKDLRLTAIDLVQKAVEVAREKAQANNVKIQFEVVNMLDDLSNTSLKEHSFDVILDSAIFHVFNNEDRLPYIKNLAHLIKPGGLYIQLCYSEKETRAGGPRRVRKADLHELFSTNTGWTIESIEDSVYESRPDGPFKEDGRAYLSLIRRDK